MSLTAAPNYYEALGLPKDCTPAQIKTSYRKLVLKCHPDKVVDEAKKAAAVDVFHRIQQAYEVLSDDQRRIKYDASVKLAAMREEVLKRQQKQHPTTQVPKSHPQPQPQTYHPPQAHARPAEPKINVEPPSAHAPFTPRSPRPYSATRPSAVADEYEEYVPNRKPYSYGAKETRKAATPRTEREERSHKKGVEKMERHQSRRAVDNNRRFDRETKRAPPVVEDNSDDYFTEKSGKSYERSPRPAEESGDGMDRHMRDAFAHIKQTGTYMRPPDVEEPYESARRSSAPRRKDYSSRKPTDRPRYNSEPFLHVPRTARSPHPDDFDHPRRARTFEPEKSSYFETAPVFKRADTMPTTSTKRPERPETSSRSDQKQRQPTEVRNGLHTPGTSPPYDQPPSAPPKSTSRSTVYEINDSENSVREIASHDSRRYTRSPSPSRDDLKQREGSRSARPKPRSINTDFGPYDHHYSSPRSARAHGYESRRGSLDRDAYEAYEGRDGRYELRSSSRRPRDMAPPLKQNASFMSGIFSR